MPPATAESRRPGLCGQGIGLAEWGRKDIAIAAIEIRAEATSEEFGAAAAQGRPHLRSLHMTIQTAGADRDAHRRARRRRPWASCNIYSTRSRRRAGRGAGTRVFAVKGESLVEYWDYTHRIFEGRTAAPQHDPRRRRRRHPAGASRAARRKGDTAFLEKASNEEEEVLFAAIRSGSRTAGWYTRSPRTSKASPRRRPPRPRLYIMEREGKSCSRHQRQRLGPKSKFDNLYGCRESLVDGIRRGTDVDDGRQGRDGGGLRRRRQGLGRLIAPGRMPCAGLRGRSICALQAAMEGYEVTTMEDAAARADIFVTATGNIDVITIEHMRAMKDRAIVCTSVTSTLKFRSERLKNFKWHNVKPQVDEVEFATASASPLVVRPGW